MTHFAYPVSGHVVSDETSLPLRRGRGTSAAAAACGCVRVGAGVCGSDPFSQVPWA